MPGIVELLYYKSSTGKALSNLAHALLHGPSPLSEGEREIIAAHVSNLNQCEFCYESHAASANAHLMDNGILIGVLKIKPEASTLSPMMKALLKIAGQVQKSGRDVTQNHIDEAKMAGASDEAIHDTVLIAAAFCMFNRYVDGLHTNLPDDKKEYIPMGERMAKKGYKYPPSFLRKYIIRKTSRSKNGTSKS